MMLGLNMDKLSMYLYQNCCTLTTALCQYLPLRIFLEALCQYMYLWPSGTVPKYTSIAQWHCAKVYFYTLVALCQSIPLYPSGTVPLPGPTCMHLLPLAVHIWMRAFEYLSLASRREGGRVGEVPIMRSQCDVSKCVHNIERNQ